MRSLTFLLVGFVRLGRVRGNEFRQCHVGAFPESPHAVVSGRLLIVRKRRVQTLRKVLRAQVGVTQQHAHITVATEMLEVYQGETAKCVAPCLGDARNGFMAQVVDT